MYIEWFFLFLAAICFHNFYWKRKGLPPGPVPLPLIGNLLELNGKEAELAADKFREKYGNIYTLWASERPMVVVADYKLMYEAFVRDGEATAGRMCIGDFQQHVRGGDYGVVFVDGDIWKIHRRFALHTFKNFGMGRNVMEEKIQLEIGYFFDAINNQTVSSNVNEKNVTSLVEVTVASVINQLLFGFSYSSTPEKLDEFITIKNAITEHLRVSIRLPVILAMHYPTVAQYIPGLREAYQLFVGGYKTIVGYCQKQVDKHRKAFDSDRQPEDYVEAYLAEAGKKTDTFDDVQLVNVLYDMFIAGQETTSTTIIYAILYALNFPKKQAALQAELDREVGPNRRVSMDDKSRLPYVNAFINETQRYVNLLPQILPHKTLRDVRIQNYTIPKGTTVLPQISSVLYDNHYFPEFDVFKPERFLDESGQLVRIDQLVPFGIGKRQCLGEPLARMELFLFIANFFNSYEVSAVRPLEPPSLTRNNGLTVQPVPFTCIVDERS